MKRYLSLVAALLVTSSISASDAEVAARQDNKDMRLPSTDVREPMGPMENHPPMRKVTPAIYPQVKVGNSVTTYTSFIWWKAYLQGLNYATSGSADNNTFVPVGTNVNEGVTARPNFSFKPGFKLGLGGPCLHDGWDVRGDYTWLGGSGMNSGISAKTNSGLVSLFNITFPDGLVKSVNARRANSSFSQQFNIADFELGRSFFISPNLILRPHLGMKTAWIQESVRFNYTVAPNNATFTYNSVTQTVVTASMIRDQNMWGLGVRTGLNGDWKFNRNFGFYGKCALSALWSDFHVKSRDLTGATGTGVTTNLNTHQSVIQVTPVIETAFGLAYTAWTSDENYRFMVRGSWEQQAWLNMNHMTRTQLNGNLTMQGFTLDFNFTF